MKMEDKDNFMGVMKGIPSTFITRVLNRYRTGSNWTGCSKELIVNQLFNGFHKGDLENLPTLEALRNEAREAMKWTKEYSLKEAERKAKFEAMQAEEALLKVSMSKPQKEEVRVKIKEGYRINRIEVYLTRENDGDSIVI